MGEAVEQRRRHLRVAEDPGPFAEAEVCGDDNAGAFVEFAQQVEEQRPAGGAEWQIAKLVENDEVGIAEASGDLPPGGPSVGGRRHGGRLGEACPSPERPRKITCAANAAGVRRGCVAATRFGPACAGLQDVLDTTRRRGQRCALARG